jgi:hypothetical protein
LCAWSWFQSLSAWMEDASEGAEIEVRRAAMVLAVYGQI